MTPAGHSGQFGGARAIRNLMSRVTSTEQDRSVAPTPATVTIGVSGVSNSAVDGLRSRVQASVQAASSALGIRRPISVMSANLPRPSEIWTLIDGRPAAVIDYDARQSEQDGWAEQTARRIVAILNSRYALLLDDAERSFHAEAIRRITNDDRDEFYVNVPAYLLDSGVTLDAERFTQQIAQDAKILAEPTPAAVAEVVLNAVAAREVILQMPRNALDGADDREIPQVRIDIFDETGVQFPDITLDIDDQAEHIRLRANGVWLETGVSGSSPWPKIGAAIKSTIVAHADWFVRSKTVGEHRGRLSIPVKSLIQLSRASYSDAVIASCLRALIRSGQNVRNLQRVLWLLHDTIDCPEDDSVSFRGLAGEIPTDAEADPESLAARVRARINDEGWRNGKRVARPPYVVLPRQLADQFRNRTQFPEVEARVVAGYRARRSEADVGLAVAPCPDLVAPLRFALGALENPPPVICVQELPIDAEIETLRL